MISQGSCDSENWSNGCWKYIYLVSSKLSWYLDHVHLRFTMLQWPPSLWWNWALYQMLPSSSSSVAYSSSLSRCPTTTIWDAGPRRSESPASTVTTHLVLGDLSDGPLGWSFHQKIWTVTQPTTSTCSPCPKAFILAYTQHMSLPLVSNSISFCLFVFVIFF